MPVAVLLPAAGQGTRMGGTPKQFRTLGGEPVLVRTLRRFDAHPEISQFVIAVSEAEVQPTREMLGALHFRCPVLVCAGGASRQASVGKALAATPPECEIVMVHDAVRPFVEVAHLNALLHAVREHGAAALAIPVADTLRRGADGLLHQTVSRDGLYQMQTPQAFRRALLEDAHARANEDATDEVALVQSLGYPVHLVEGSSVNFKITRPADWTLAQAVHAQHVQAPMRIGFGYDVHRLVHGRPLILGGVAFDHPLGLDGHSDADVVLHALCDALLGAAALGDIGAHFPNTDERWRGADSRALLRHVMQVVRDAGFNVSNVDVMVALEAPKLRPHIDQMRANIAADLDVAIGQVSVKAGTNEKMGFIGRQEGAAAYAVACLIAK